MHVKLLSDSFQVNLQMMKWLSVHVITIKPGVLQNSIFQWLRIQQSPLGRIRRVHSLDCENKDSVISPAAETGWRASEIFIRKEGAYVEFIIRDLSTEPVAQGLREDTEAPI